MRKPWNIAALLAVLLVCSACFTPSGPLKTIEGTFTPEDGCRITYNGMKTDSALSAYVSYSEPALYSGPNRAGARAVVMPIADW